MHHAFSVKPHINCCSIQSWGYNVYRNHIVCLSVYADLCPPLTFLCAEVILGKTCKRFVTKRIGSLKMSTCLCHVSYLQLCFFYTSLLIFQIWSIVVFGCIIAEGWHGDQCQMHGDSNACGYGTGIGILAFIICLVFLVLDAMFDNISSVQHRKYVVLADLGISGNEMKVL